MNMQFLLMLASLLFANAMTCAAPEKPVKSATMMASDTIMQGAIIAHDKVDMDPIALMFRGERTTVDQNGFFSFVIKNDREAFEPIPFKNKMMQVINEGGDEVALAPSADSSAAVSPLLPPNTKQDKFYLLITQSLECVVEGLNDVSGFRQIAGAPHLFFSFIAQNSVRPNGKIVIKSTSLKKRNYLYAPHRTIVVLMNPNRVKKLEYWPFQLESQFIQIPRIELLSEQEILERKQSKNPEMASVQPTVANNIGRQAAKSNFLSLELKPFFQEQDRVVVWKKQRKDQPVKVEMIVS